MLKFIFFDQVHLGKSFHGMEENTVTFHKAQLKK